MIKPLPKPSNKSNQNMEIHPSVSNPPHNLSLQHSPNNKRQRVQPSKSFVIERDELNDRDSD